MSTRLVNKITGTTRDFPDRLAAQLVADESTGWHAPSTRRPKTTATEGDNQNQGE